MNIMSFFVSAYWQEMILKNVMSKSKMAFFPIWHGI